jgi:hypothetical protein
MPGQGQAGRLVRAGDLEIERGDATVGGEQGGYGTR